MRSIPALIIFLMVVMGCGLEKLSRSEYGLLKIQAPNGEVFYFRREARGLNYDALSLSKNSNVCTQPDPDSALIFTSLGPVTVFYRFEGNELHLYKMSPVEVPENFSDSIKLVFHDITNQELLMLRESYADKGLGISEVPFDPALSCWN